jgi:hypothetical protein
MVLLQTVNAQQTGELSQLLDAYIRVYWSSILRPFNGQGQVAVCDKTLYTGTTSQMQIRLKGKWRNFWRYCNTKKLQRSLQTNIQRDNNKAYFPLTVCILMEYLTLAASKGSRREQYKIRGRNTRLTPQPTRHFFLYLQNDTQKCRVSYGPKVLQ